MKATYLGLAAAALIGACAVQTNVPDSTCVPGGANCSVAGATGSSGGTTGGGASGSSSGGALPNAGAPTSGASSGGAAQGGTAQGGTAQGGTAQGGTAQGGTAQGVTAQGGTAQGGNGGPAAGGTAAGGSGAGGAAAGCTKAIPATTTWVGSAAAYSGDGTGVCVSNGPTDALCNKPAYAFDGDLSTRFSTGTKQVGTEYLLIDFGANKATVSKVIVNTTNNDYGRHLQIRMSDSATDATSAVLAEQNGMTGPVTFTFPPTTARYLRIMQTAMLATGEINWWSVHEIAVSCTP